jgi:GxxExxY protein
MGEFFYRELSYKVVRLAFNVHNSLGPGLKEALYQNAFCVELRKAGLPFECQKGFVVEHEGETVGRCRADLVVDGKIVLEIKARTHLLAGHQAQLINYLRLSKIKVGYIMNFHGPRLEWHRFIYTIGCP